MSASGCASHNRRDFYSSNVGIERYCSAGGGVNTSSTQRVVCTQRPPNNAKCKNTTRLPAAILHGGCNPQMRAHLVLIVFNSSLQGVLHKSRSLPVWIALAEVDGAERDGQWGELLPHCWRAKRLQSPC